MLRIRIALVAPLLLAATPTPKDEQRVGDRFTIVSRYETSSRDDRDGTGSSSGGSAMEERVVALHADAIDLEYDLSQDATADDRARQWRYPVRIRVAKDGRRDILNEGEMRGRLTAWLARWKIAPAACGHWLFTWNAFKIECDPRSVLADIDNISLRSITAREGAAYVDRLASAPAILRASTSERSVLTADYPLDPAKLRQEKAESDLVVAEIMGKPTTMEAALKARERDRFSATRTIRLEVDAAGRVWRRTVVTNSEHIDPVMGREVTTGRVTTESRPHR